MKHTDLNSDLTIIGLIFTIIICSFLFLGIKLNEYKLQQELLNTKKVAVDLYEENQTMNRKVGTLYYQLEQKNQELKEFNELKKLKEDVRTFWDGR